MQKISAAIPPRLREELEARARAEDRSVSSVVRRALIEHLRLSSTRSSQKEKAA